MPGRDWQKILDTVAADQRTFLGKVSDSAKYMWAGAFGVFYAGALADKPPLKTFFEANANLIVLAVEFGGAAFLLDVLKNVLAARLNGQLTRLILDKQADPNLDALYVGTIDGSALVRLNKACYALSVVCSLVSGGLIAACLFSFKP